MKATDEALRIALNLARNRGYAVFPVAENKHPTKPKPKNGDGGCKEATKDADQIKWLWQHWPGPLIGVRTGAESGIDVLDVDIKHDQTLWWWRDNNRRLLPTRTFETRSGGLHLIYQHEDGVRNTQGKIHKGVDTRGDGGYLVYWFADGFGCFDHTPPQPWPAWLLIELTRKDEPEKVTKDNATFSSDSAIAGIVRTLETAAGGTRNGILFWCANRLRERGFSQAEAETLLLPAVPKPNDPKKDRGTIASAYRGRAAA